MPDRAGTIDVDGFKLGYRIEGSGTPTIVIGFAAQSARTFSTNLRRHLQLVFLDHRGAVPLPEKVDPRSFELATIVDDIELARKTLGLERIAIAGHSGNAYMALEYAKKYPANVSRVIMIGIAPDLGAKNTELRERHWEESASPERKARFAENLQRLPDDQLAKLPPNQQFISVNVRMAPRAWYDPYFDPTEVFRDVVVNAVMWHVWGRIFPTLDITKGLDALDCPVFLALGRYDFVVAPSSSWDPIRHQFKDLTVRMFEKSGHSPQFEEPELFDRELLAWMNR